VEIGAHALVKAGTAEDHLGEHDAPAGLHDPEHLGADV
jgi:hypothetical protein